MFFCDVIGMYTVSVDIPCVYIWPFCVHTKQREILLGIRIHCIRLDQFSYDCHKHVIALTFCPSAILVKICYVNFY